MTDIHVGGKPKPPGHEIDTTVERAAHLMRIYLKSATFNHRTQLNELPPIGLILEPHQVNFLRRIGAIEKTLL